MNKLDKEYIAVTRELRAAYIRNNDPKRIKELELRQDELVKLLEPLAPKLN